MRRMMGAIRIGIDLGGTKIEAIALAADGRELLRRRIATPQGDYDATVQAVVRLVVDVEQAVGATGKVGVGMPGAISPATGRTKNANSTWLIGRPLDRDLATALGRPVRLQNDANCLAVSEATDGAGVGCDVVFAVIIGTGVGGGIVVRGWPITGRNAVAGEWGHTQLPWREASERPGLACYCCLHGCIETLLSGPGLARGLANMINILDPDAIVLGGGLSNLERLYRNVPAIWDRWVFSDRVDTPLPRAAHGDSSGVRGAAWLWPPAR
jgi:fructokinase